MRTIQINEAESSFHALLAAVEAGEELALTRHGRVVARMLPGGAYLADSRAAGFRGGSERAIETRYTIETGLISPLD